jgi:hypothetical protein
MRTETMCSCGERAPHVIARQTTADGIAVEIWHDGAITGRSGLALPGVPVSRPRTADAFERERHAASLFSGEVSIYMLAELPRLHACARRVAARGGLPGDLRAAFAAQDAMKLRLVWAIYATDRDWTPTVRVARLDRMRWPGLVVWHERGRYDLLSLRRGIALASRSREALETTGLSFGSQRELRAHLFSVQVGALEANR